MVCEAWLSELPLRSWLLIRCRFPVRWWGEERWLQLTGTQESLRTLSTRRRERHKHLNVFRLSKALGAPYSQAPKERRRDLQGAPLLEACWLMLLTVARESWR